MEEVRDQEIKTYKAANYISPKVFLNVSKDHPGVVMLYLFAVSPSRVEAEDDRCDKISITLAPDAENADDDIVRMMIGGAPITSMSLRDFAGKNNWYLTAKVLPGTFWEQSEALQREIVDHMSISVLAEVADRTQAATQAFAIDLFCREYAMVEEIGALKGSFVFQRFFNLESIKVSSMFIKGM